MNKTAQTTMNIVVLALAFVFLSVYFFNSGNADGADNYNITDNIVWFEDKNVILEAYPHTITNSQYVTFNLTPKWTPEQYNGSINAIWGFNSNGPMPKSAEYYKPHSVPVEKSYTCDSRNFTNSTSTYFYCWNDIIECIPDDEQNTTCTNITTSVLAFEHDYEQWDEIDTAYWTETHIEDYVNIFNIFTKKNFDYGGMDTWYITNNVSVNAENEYSIRAWIDVPFNTQGKYWFCVKPSGMTIQEAKTKGHLYCLDPWWNSSWDYKKEIQIDGIGDSNPDNYQFKIEIDYESTMNDTFKDLRFTWLNGSTEQEIDYWIETYTASTDATVWLKLPEVSNTSNETYNMYYGNPTATSESNGPNTFDLYDDFDDAYFNTTLWESYGGATPTESGTFLTGGHNPNHYAIRTNEPVIINTDISFKLDYKMKMNKDDQNGWYSGNCNFVTYYPTLSTELGTFQSQWEGSYRLYFQGATVVTESAQTWDYVNLKSSWFLWDTKGTGYVKAEHQSGNGHPIMSYASTASIRNDTYVSCTYGDLDYIRVRKYTATEPTYSIGAEETSNTAPTITANSTSPATIYANTDTTANLTVTDPEGDTLTAYIQFYVNDSAVGNVVSTVVTNNTNTLVATLGSGNYSSGDNISTEYWAGDGTVNTTKANMTDIVQSQFTITLNSPVDEYNSSDNTPDFNFTVSGTDDSYSCELFLNDTGYGVTNKWYSNSLIPSGLGDVGLVSAPEVFQKDGTWYLISGEFDGVFTGFNWSGSTWQSDSIIASGLGDIGGYSKPTVFQKDGTWYLITGNVGATFNGFNWTGSTWQSDPAIKSGLGSFNFYSAPTVFQKDSTWYLINGDNDGNFYGFNWSESSWQSDSIIASGLGDIGVNSVPEVFQKDGTWYLISGNFEGTFNGFNWTGSTWQSDLSIALGLGDASDRSTPTVFQKDGWWYLITGRYLGFFTGYLFGTANNTATIITANSSVSDGYYDWNINCTAGITTNTSEIRQITIDTVTPNITIYSPTNTTYSLVTVDLNTSADEDIATWVYTLNGGNWVGFTPNTTFTAVEGNNNITITAYDYASNTNTSSTIYFTVDTTSPTVDAYYQWNSTNETMDLTYISDGSMTINWNVSDVSGINVSSCSMYHRYFDNSTQTPIFNYINGVQDINQDVNGYTTLSCENITINSTSERLYYNFTEPNAYLQYIASVYHNLMVDDGHSGILGNKIIMARYDNHTTGANKTIEYNLQIYNSSNTVAPFLVTLCNKYADLTAWQTDPDCLEVGAFYAGLSIPDSQGYQNGLATTNGSGYLGLLLITDTMYTIGSCPDCTNANNDWEAVYTNINNDDSYTSANNGASWTEVGWEFNTYANYFNEVSFEANLTVSDNLGNSINDFRFDYYGEIPNEPPAVAINTDNVTGNLISYYDIHNITESGVIWFNTSIADDDTQGVNCTFYLLNNDTTINTTLLTDYNIPSGFGTCPYEWNTSTLPDGDYRVKVSATDGVLTNNRTSAGFIRLDNTAPVITIIEPTNTTYNTTSIDLNVSADETIDTWWYSLNGGSNQTFSPNISITAIEGSNNITIYANDSVNNIGSLTQYFTVVLNVEPVIIANLTSPSILYNNTDLLLNLTITDENPDNITGYTNFYINEVLTGATQLQAVVNNTNTLVATLSSANFVKGDSIIIEIWAGDETINTTEINLSAIIVQNSIPTVPDMNPPANVTIGTTYQLLTCENSTDIDDDTIYYQFYGSSNISNLILLQNSTNTTYNWSSLSGNNYFKCGASDLEDSINTSIVKLTIDTLAPLISIISPSSQDTLDTTLHLQAISTELGSMWYSLNGGSNTTLCSLCTSSPLLALPELQVGTHSIVVYGNDSVGNIGYNTRTFTIIVPLEGGPSPPTIIVTPEPPTVLEPPEDIIIETPTLSVFGTQIGGNFTLPQFSIENITMNEKLNYLLGLPIIVNDNICFDSVSIKGFVNGSATYDTIVGVEQCVSSLDVRVSDIVVLIGMLILLLVALSFITTIKIFRAKQKIDKIRYGV